MVNRLWSGAHPRSMMACGKKALLLKNHFINIDQNVSKLLDPDTGDWNVNVLDEHFFQVNVELILKK